MPLAKIILVAILILFVQMWFGAALRDVGAEANFILIFVMYLSCYFDPLAGMSAGFVLGFSEDVLRMECFGLGALTYILVGYLPRVLGNVFYLENLVAQYFYLVLAHGLKLVLESIVEPSLTHSLPDSSILIPQRLMSLGLDAVLMPLLFLVFIRIIGRKEPVGGRTRSKKKMDFIRR